MKRLSVIWLLVVMGIGSVPLFAQGEATLLFLMINPGAREGGMGEAGVALAEDATAIYWNPAGLAFQFEDPEVDARYDGSLMHVNWLPKFNLDDLYYDYLAGRMHLDNIGTVGLGVQFINYGENVQTDVTGAEIGRFTSNEFAITGSYGLKLSQGQGFGVNLKLAYSRLSDVQVDAEEGKGVGTTFAVDLGYLYKPMWMPQLSLGANLSNLGPKIAYVDDAQADPIPTNLRMGLAYDVVNSEFNRFTVVYDVNRLLVPRDEDKRRDNFLTYLYSSWGDGDFVKRFSHSIGAEYWYTNLIALRTGYFYEDENYGNRKFITFGGGLRVSVFGVDFSYILASVDDHPLADTIRFSLSAKL